MGAWGIGHWLVVLLIVLVVFGTKKLRNMGGDLGSAIKGFKEGMKSESDKTADTAAAKGEIPPAPGQTGQTGQTYDAEVKKETSKS